jgi:hypothetical protein
VTVAAGEPFRTRVGVLWLELLEPKAIAGGHSDVRVQADTAHARAALTSERGEVLRVDAVADTKYAPPGPGSRRHAARDRGGVEAGEQRLLLGQEILRRVGVGAETPALEQPREARRDPLRHAGHLGVVRVLSVSLPDFG